MKKKTAGHYFLKREMAKKIKIALVKYFILITMLGILPVLAIYCAGIDLVWCQDDDYNTESHNLIMKNFAELREEERAENAKLDKYDDILATLGIMGQEIKKASIEFGADNDEAVEIMGLSIGIANAESTLGKKFVIAYDLNCSNWWGIKRMRADGSSLRCFNDERAGARTMASLLKRLYLGYGLDTPEKIVNKYVGNKWTQYHNIWVSNVNKYYL